MTGNHLGLIVEDDSATAADLAEILQSFGCESRTVSNKRDALARLDERTFCFVLLDLEIKAEPDSIKGHTEHGNSLLREIRHTHSEHNGDCHWLPVLIVSGFAREVPAAVEAMKDGANDVIEKPFVGRDVSARIRRALERAGRATHDSCGIGAVNQSLPADAKIALTIPGHRRRRRTRVMVGSRSVMLPDSALRLLLLLMVGHLDGLPVHKRTLGATDDQGFKGVSTLRALLEPALGEGVSIIDNDYHGNYSLTKQVGIGEVDFDALEKIGDLQIAELTIRLRTQLAR